MSIVSWRQPYDASKAKRGDLQPEIFPLPVLRRPWFKGGRIACEEGWSVSYGASASRIDRHNDYENGRHVSLSGEGGGKQLDVFVDSEMYWDEPVRAKMDEDARQRVLRNLTVALQWDGYSVFFC